MKFAKKRIIWPLAVLSVAFVVLWPANAEHRIRRSAENSTTTDTISINLTGPNATSSNITTSSFTSSRLTSSKDEGTESKVSNDLV